MNGLDRIGKYKDLYKLCVSSPLCGKSLGMNMLDTCDSIDEIVSVGVISAISQLGKSYI